MDWFTGGPVTITLDERQSAVVSVSLSMKSGWKGFIKPKEGIQISVDQ
jgi:hypothetical protein